MYEPCADPVLLNGRSLASQLCGKCLLGKREDRVLRSYYNEKLRTLSVPSLKKQHVVVSDALLDAVRDSVIPTNFAAYVEFPMAKKFEGKACVEEQVAALWETV